MNCVANASLPRLIGKRRILVHCLEYTNRTSGGIHIRCVTHNRDEPDSETGWSSKARNPRDQQQARKDEWEEEPFH
jgi:hypothetical protein